MEQFQLKEFYIDLVIISVIQIGNDALLGNSQDFVKTNLTYDEKNHSPELKVTGAVSSKGSTLQQQILCLCLEREPSEKYSF